MTGDAESAGVEVCEVAVAEVVVVEVAVAVAESAAASETVAAVEIEVVVGRIVVDVAGRGTDCLDLSVQGSCCGSAWLGSCSRIQPRKTNPLFSDRRLCRILSK